MASSGRSVRRLLICGTMLMAHTLNAQLRDELESREEIERLRAVTRYATSPPGGAPFPPPPHDIGPYYGPLLQDWLPDDKPGVVEVIPVP